MISPRLATPPRRGLLSLRTGFPLACRVFPQVFRPPPAVALAQLRPSAPRLPHARPNNLEATLLAPVHEIGTWRWLRDAMASLAGTAVQGPGVLSGWPEDSPGSGSAGSAAGTLLLFGQHVAAPR